MFAEHDARGLEGGAIFWSDELSPGVAAEVVKDLEKMTNNESITHCTNDKLLKSSEYFYPGNGHLNLFVPG